MSTKNREVKTEISVSHCLKMKFDENHLIYVTRARARRARRFLRITMRFIQCFVSASYVGNMFMVKMWQIFPGLIHGNLGIYANIFNTIPTKIG